MKKRGIRKNVEKPHIFGNIPMYAYIAIILGIVIIVAIFFTASPQEPIDLSGNLAGQATLFRYAQQNQVQKANQNQGLTSCFDADQGSNQFVQASTRLVRNGRTIQTETDECTGKSTVMEFFCDSNAQGPFVNKGEIQCLGQCVNGACVQGNNVNTGASKAIVSQQATQTSVCGNSIVEGREQCDDGNKDNFDGCTQSCIEAEMYNITTTMNTTVGTNLVDFFVKREQTQRWATAEQAILGIRQMRTFQSNSLSQRGETLTLNSITVQPQGFSGHSYLFTSPFCGRSFVIEPRVEQFRGDAAIIVNGKKYGFQPWQEVMIDKDQHIRLNGAASNNNGEMEVSISLVCS